MSEADLREGLRAAVGDEPPLDFDADELIRRAQHVRRRRRALVAVAVATLALTGTVLALPGVLDQRRAVDAAGGPVLTTTGAATTRTPVPAQASTSPPALIRPPATAGTAKSHVPLYLSKKFVEVAPYAKVVSADTTGSPPEQLYAWLSFVDGVGASRVLVRLVPSSSGVTRGEYCAEAGCEEPVLRADGSYVTSTWRTTAVPDPQGADPQGVMHTVSHFRVDGSVVEATGFGYEPPAGGEAREQVALGYEQLVSLATDPDLAAS
ncbi:hypothetical protein [Saccharothrix texasensis]|uniref:Uncharacterized protein n=1 Tax=Saccharothrix texasensis TaxID=103734 RepID=A0A3N1HAJ6_9PSEU|nr:hypothetical protein [Saccharothrix texasensis]ROP39554.1 hypothetical protein EDD40_4943 [Saccharothrix texasensis]